MNTMIADAIATQTILRLFYDGGERTIEPHCYGAGRTGHELLRAFQTAGHSKSGGVPGWKLFRVDRMSAMRMTNEHFAGPRPGYNPNGDKHMPRIYCKL